MSVKLAGVFVKSWCHILMDHLRKSANKGYCFCESGCLDRCAKELAGWMIQCQEEVCTISVFQTQYFHWSCFSTMGCCIFEPLILDLDCLSPFVWLNVMMSRGGSWIIMNVSWNEVAVAIVYWVISMWLLVFAINECSLMDFSFSPVVFRTYWLIYSANLAQVYQSVACFLCFWYQFSRNVLLLTLVFTV